MAGGLCTTTRARLNNAVAAVCDRRFYQSREYSSEKSRRRMASPANAEQVQRAPDSRVHNSISLSMIRHSGTRDQKTFSANEALEHRRIAMPLRARSSTISSIVRVKFFRRPSRRTRGDDLASTHTPRSMRHAWVLLRQSEQNFRGSPLSQEYGGGQLCKSLQNKWEIVHKPLQGDEACLGVAISGSRR